MEVSDMTEAIVVALITGGLTLIGVIITCITTSNKTESAIRINQAVTDTKLNALTEEVRKHNNFAQRMPAVEQRIESLEHRMDKFEERG